MPNIERHENESPGDLLRRIADWFDETGEPMPDMIDIGYHGWQTADRGSEYAAAFRERYNLVEKHAGGSSWTALHLLAEDEPGLRPRVHVVAWRPHLTPCEIAGCTMEHPNGRE